jgi:hypothetical protein
MMRAYWREYRPDQWLFPGKNPDNYLSIGTVQRVYHQAKEKAGVIRGRGILDADQGTVVGESKTGTVALRLFSHGLHPAS